MPQEIEKTAVLGDGSFGTVYQGRARSKDVAVKVLHKQDLDAKTLAAFRKEVEILRCGFAEFILLHLEQEFHDRLVHLISLIVTSLFIQSNLSPQHCAIHGCLHAAW